MIKTNGWLDELNTLKLWFDLFPPSAIRNNNANVGWVWRCRQLWSLQSDVRGRGLADRRQPARDDRGGARGERRRGEEVQVQFLSKQDIQQETRGDYIIDINNMYMIIFILLPSITSFI